jgi:hypothetical protein
MGVAVLKVPQRGGASIAASSRMRDGNTPQAVRPFALTGCIELRKILGRRARDERELMEEIEQAGAAGRVRQNFLITLQLREYLSIMVHLTA